MTPDPPRTPAMNRRQFLGRTAAGLTALSSPPLALLAQGCTRPDAGDQAAPDPAALRRWAADLRGGVILPGDAAYESARRVWNLAVDRRPAAIVRCAAVDDVLRALELARRHELDLAVRSGGHGQAGHAVCDGGVVVDLAGLRDLAVDEAGLTARAGAGIRTGELLAAARPHGLATPMGSCPAVGLPGLTLGGGENTLMARYGVVCDSLLSATVVTADGRVLTASPEEHPDLFWALRGGGGNFGIVTSLEYRLHPVGEVLAGTLLFPLSQARDVLPRYRDLMRAAPDELHTSGGLVPLPEGPALAVGVTWCGDLEAGARQVEGLRARLGPTSDDVRPAPYAADFNPPPVAHDGSGGFLPDLGDEVIDVLATHFEAAPTGSTAMWNDYHGAVTRVARSETAFPLRDPGYHLFTNAPWSDAAGREAAVAWVEAFRQALHPFTRGVYVNALGEEGEERAREAYGANLARLASIKARYDPDNVFRLNQNIAPEV